MTRHAFWAWSLVVVPLTVTSAYSQAIATISFDSGSPSNLVTDAWNAHGTFSVAAGWTANSVICYAVPATSNDSTQVRKRYHTITSTLDPANGIWDAGGNGLPNGSYEVWVELLISHPTQGDKRITGVLRSLSVTKSAVQIPNLIAQVNIIFCVRYSQPSQIVSSGNFGIVGGTLISIQTRAFPTLGGVILEQWAGPTITQPSTWTNSKINDPLAGVAYRVAAFMDTGGGIGTHTIVSNFAYP